MSQGDESRGQWAGGDTARNSVHPEHSCDSTSLVVTKESHRGTRDMPCRPLKGCAVKVTPGKKLEERLKR